MSRHRIIKNMDLDEELDDEAIDSGGEEDMSPEDHARLESALTAMHAKLGAQSLILDRDIKDALWNYYFDVDEALAFLKDEQRKKEKAAAPAPAPAPAPALAKNKLAAKIAAAKAAKLAASSAPSPGPAVALPAGATVAVPAADGEKKLSKLQLKMLASQAARKSPLPPVVAVAPLRAPSPPPPPLDALPSTPHFAPAPCTTVSLRASPSRFATTLAPSPSPSRDVLAKIELAMRRDSAVASAGTPAFDGPSPDDVVLLARKGTSLGAVSKRK